MCLTCGCGQPDHHDHDHDHDHDHRARVIAVERDLLELNDRHAGAVRALLQEHGVLGLNLVSSPGAGKTTLLVKTISELLGRIPVAVIEGDQQTERDGDRIRATGAPALQLNTGKGCHLEARSVHRAFERLPVPSGGVLFIENVGNLVCPALFDLGEAHKVAILSVPEGDDKPLKYPHMFRAADLVVINKSDLLPHVDFDVSECVARCRRVNPEVEVLVLSASTGEGLEAWLDWIERARRGISPPSAPLP